MEKNNNAKMAEKSKNIIANNCNELCFFIIFVEIYRLQLTVHLRVRRENQ